jgi:hypothetical protein
MNRCAISGWLSLIVCGLAMQSCEDNVRLSMMVWKDCTGTYLQYDSLDYKVCNPGVVADFSTGQTVEASYTLENACDDPSVENYICNLYHPYESLITVTDISN